MSGDQPFAMFANLTAPLHYKTITIAKGITDMRFIKLATVSSASIAFLGGSIEGATLLSTGFDGTALGGAPDMTGITYTDSTGLTGPASLDSGSYTIFSTAAATGHFAPNVQINGGSWALTFDMTVGGSDLTIDDVQIDRQHFNVAGALNPSSTTRSYPMTVSLTGSSSGLLDSSSLDPAPNWGSSEGIATFNFGGATAQAGETLTLTLLVGDGGSAGSGVYVGIDGFTVNGNLVPEPSHALYAALGSAALLLRRRQRAVSPIFSPKVDSYQR